MKKQTSPANRKFNFTNRFLTGLVIALAATLTAFEWTTVTTDVVVFPPLETDEIVEIVPPLRFKIKKLKKPEPQKPSDQLKLVKEIIEPTEEIKPDKKPVEKGTETVETMPDFEDLYGAEEVEEIDFNKEYRTVQIFAHYDECASLDGDALMECSKVAIMNQVRKKFVISRWLRDVGGRQAAQVSFVIDQEGNIGGIEVLQATSKAMAKDAKKAVGKLPAMNPAVQQGRNVKLRMEIPIVVKL